MRVVPHYLHGTSPRLRYLKCMARGSELATVERKCSWGRGNSRAKPAQSIDSRIFLCFPPLLLVVTIRQVSVDKIGTRAAVSSFAMLNMFSAVREWEEGKYVTGSMEEIPRRFHLFAAPIR